MSAPDTNVNKEERRHRAALSGIRIALIVVALMLLWFLFWGLSDSENPEGADAQVDGRTGEIEATD